MPWIIFSHGDKDEFTSVSKGQNAFLKKFQSGFTFCVDLRRIFFKETFNRIKILIRFISDSADLEVKSSFRLFQRCIRLCASMEDNRLNGKFGPMGFTLVKKLFLGRFGLFLKLLPLHN